DTFDPSGPNPDVYAADGGFKVFEDDGRLIVLTEQAGQSISAGAVVPLRLDDSSGGATVYRNNILTCSGSPHSTGDVLSLDSGFLFGTTLHAVGGLIAQDPTATWDLLTRQVVGSAFPQSPRVILI